MGWQPEDLSAQVDGIETYFTTTFLRTLSRVVVFLNGEKLPQAQFEEPDAGRIRVLTPPPFGAELFVVYWTDQTFDGRVKGFTEDPSGGGELPAALEDLLEAYDQRLDALEALSPGRAMLEHYVTSAGQTEFSISFTPILMRPILLIANRAVYTREGGHFTVGGVEDKTVTWIHTGFAFDDDDQVELIYWTQE